MYVARFAVAIPGGCAPPRRRAGVTASRSSAKDGASRTRAAVQSRARHSRERGSRAVAASPVLLVSASVRAPERWHAPLAQATSCGPCPAPRSVRHGLAISTQCIHARVAGRLPPFRSATSRNVSGCILPHPSKIMMATILPSTIAHGGSHLASQRIRRPSTSLRKSVPVARRVAWRMPLRSQMRWNYAQALYKTQTPRSTISARP